MKIFTTLIILCASISIITAQSECNPGLAEPSVLRNDFRQSTTSSLANLNFTANDKDYVYDADGISPLFNIGFARGIWAGGIDATGNFKIAASGYGQSGNDFIPGPIWNNFQNNEGLCSFYKRVWTIDNYELATLRDSYAKGLLTAENIPADILEWPAQGNPHIGIYAPDYDMAPYYDSDQNDVYDPLMGDYPIPLEESPNFFPSQFRFFVYNDLTAHNHSEGEPISMEFHVIDYMVNCEDDTEAEKSVFTRLNYLYKGLGDLRDFRIGIWDDTDLGCFEDDYQGCAPMLDASYVYNTNGQDGNINGDCQNDLLGIPQNIGTVKSFVFLNKKLESHIPYFNGALTSNQVQTGPQTLEQYYSYLNAEWLDGTPLTSGGNGLNPGSQNITMHAFTDFPNQLDGWSMQSENFPASDTRTISVFDSRLEIQAGDIFSVDFVDHIMTDQDKIGLDIFEDYTETINSLKEEYENMKNGRFECGSLPEVCQSDCVWPGDVNDDGFVNGKDFVILGNQLGLGGGSGPVRSTQSTLWFPFNSSNWNESTIVGSNAKHADIDGNGEINSIDFSVAMTNIGQSRIQETPDSCLEESPLGNTLGFLLTSNEIDASESFFINKEIKVFVKLGDANELLEEPIHGLTYEIKYDTSFVHFFSFPTTDNALSDFEETGFHTKPLIRDGFGFSGDDKMLFYQTNLSGQNVDKGQILPRFSLIVKEDAVTNNPDGRDTLVLKFYNVFGTNAAGEEVQFGAKYDSVFISNLIYDPNHISTSVSDINHDLGFTISPNPADDYLDVSLAQPQTGELSIYTTTGAVHSTHQFKASDQERISVYELDPGLYIISMRVDDRITSTKFIKL